MAMQVDAVEDDAQNRSLDRFQLFGYMPNGLSRRLVS
jgi:hypothetical protein